MSKPTQQQRAEVIAQHVKASGAMTLSVTEVALTLDGLHPGMTDDEYGDLLSELSSEVAAIRNEAIRQVWA